MAGNKRIEHAARFRDVAHRFESVDTLAEIVAAREKDSDIRELYFWPRDIAVYSAAVEDRGDGALDVQFFVSLTTNPSFNPLLRRHAGPLSAFRYSEPEYPELQRSVQAGHGLRVSYADLDNPDGLRLAHQGETSVLEIRVAKLEGFSTNSSGYFNPAQRALLIFLYGRPDAHGRMLQSEHHSTTRITLLSPAYLQKHLSELPTVRGCWVSTVRAGSVVELNDNHDGKNVGYILGYPAPPSTAIGRIRR